MVNTLLEETRQCHEDMERLERLVVKDFKNEPKTYKEKLYQGHRVKKTLERLQERAKRLREIYEDEDGARKQEIAELRGDNVFANFYKRFEEVKEYHRQFVGSNDFIGEEDDSALVCTDDMVDVAFSGEEGLGRYMDLLEHFQEWQKFGQEMTYSEYLANLENHVDAVGAKYKTGGGAYAAYLDRLIAYLSTLYERTHPLADVSDVYAKAREIFSQRWNQMNGEGQGDEGDGAVVDLERVETVDELEALGGEVLKVALMKRGLKCGGTPRQRAERLFGIKGKKPEDIDPSWLAGKKKKKSQQIEQTGTEGNLALKETIFKHFVRVLSSQHRATIEKVEKKQAQTYEEFVADMEAELEEAQQDDFGIEDEEDEYVYNPLKIPLGWDGKPIPYWLYKLHGLNHEFTCEICGGASYRGRREFEKHFTESRHAMGMKALGIPNTKQFYEITSIAEAVSLWNTLQKKKKEASGFSADVDEEVEDAEGNIFSRKMFNDLQRQGVLEH